MPIAGMRSPLDGIDLRHHGLLPSGRCGAADQVPTPMARPKQTAFCSSVSSPGGEQNRVGGPDEPRAAGHRRGSCPSLHRALGAAPDDRLRIMPSSNTLLTMRLASGGSIPVRRADPS